MIFERNDGAVATKISWIPVTEREDGSAYPAEAHYGYELGVSDPANPNDGFTPKISFPTAYATSEWPLNKLDLTVPGVYEVALRTVAKDGGGSPWSAPLVFAARVPRPNAPTGLSVS